jgi:hypothetical protein
MSFKAKLNGLLTNSRFLRVTFMVSLLNIVWFLVKRNIHAVILFLLIASIVGHFSRNMTIVFLTPLIIVNLFELQRHGSTFYEGLENNDANTKSDPEDKTKTTDDSTTKTVQQINQKASTKQGLPITPIDPDTTTTSPTDESFEVGRNKKGKYDIDYASTVEDAYDNLNSIIGGEGIQRLTSDTQKLMKQQLQLAEAMNSMGPMMDNMGPLMESVGPLLKQAQGLMGAGAGAKLDEDKK